MTLRKVLQCLCTTWDSSKRRYMQAPGPGGSCAGIMHDALRLVPYQCDAVASQVKNQTAFALQVHN